MKRAIWFRRDLRIQDNPALANALSGNSAVDAVYILSPDDTEWAIGSASKWYLHQSLLALQKDLAALGIPLKVITGSVSSSLPRYVRDNGITGVYWNRVVEPQQELLDQVLTQTLENMRVDHHVFDDDCLLMPEQGYKNDGTPYRVFTPFWKTAQERLAVDDLATRLFEKPKPRKRKISYDPGEIDRAALLDKNTWHEKLHLHWVAGETSAQKRLEQFIEQQVIDYEAKRDFPALSHTSRLSAALHFGEISVARVYSRCQQVLLHDANEMMQRGIRRFLAELGWRDFARHVLHAFPHTVSTSLNDKFEMPGFWYTEEYEKFLQSWQRGRTGFPLIDAGMRELWKTGTMHNRVRMLTASFLTKNLNIHWLEGARWFWDTLVDADLANNTLAWQWVAGCGTDAAPYYRIFNPQTQARKFDAEHRYITRWMGEEDNYPEIVNLSETRESALLRYQNHIRSSSI